jgi:hypothetical protein
MIYQAEPGSRSEQALSLLASIAADRHASAAPARRSPAG